MGYIYLIASFLLSFSCLLSAHGSTSIVSVPTEAQWAKTADCSSATYEGMTQFLSVAIDADGNIYAAGNIGKGTYDFGNEIITTGASENGNLILVKYDSSGNAQWAKTATCSGTCQTIVNAPNFNSVVADSQGNVYVVGSISGGTYHLGNGITVTGTADTSEGRDPRNIILVKYDRNGITKWAKSTSGGVYNSWFYSISLDDNSNIYAAGIIYGAGTFNFGRVTVSGSSESTNAVLVKYNKDGKAQWVRSTNGAISTSPNSEFYSVAVENNNNIYTAGTIGASGPYDFGDGAKVSGPDNGNVVLVKYDSSGNTKWAKSTISGSKASAFKSVTTDNNGNIFAVGTITEDAPYGFGNGITTVGSCGSAGCCNLVLVKYDADGNPKLAKSVLSGENWSAFNSVAFNNGTIYAAGNIVGSSTYNFGNDVVIKGAPSSENVALVEYDNNGNALQAKSVANGNPGFSQLNSVAVNSISDVGVAGFLASTQTFDFGNGVTVTAATDTYNVLVVKYSSIPPSASSSTTSSTPHKTTPTSAPTSWWSRNGDYVLVAIGGVVVIGGVAAGFASGASLVGGSSLAQGIASCACISCIVNGIGSVVVVVVPVLSKALTPATKVIGGEMQESLISGAEKIT